MPSPEGTVLFKIMISRAPRSDTVEFQFQFQNTVLKMNSTILSVQPRKKPSKHSFHQFLFSSSFFTHLQTVWPNSLKWITNFGRLHGIIVPHQNRPSWSPTHCGLIHFTVTSIEGKPKICKENRTTNRHEFLKTTLVTQGAAAEKYQCRKKTRKKCRNSEEDNLAGLQTSSLQHVPPSCQLLSRQRLARCPRWEREHFRLGLAAPFVCSAAQPANVRHALGSYGGARNLSSALSKRRSNKRWKGSVSSRRAGSHYRGHPETGKTGTGWFGVFFPLWELTYWLQSVYIYKTNTLSF